MSIQDNEYLYRIRASVLHVLTSNINYTIKVCAVWEM